MKNEKLPIKSLKLKAWKLCSEYIRRRDKGICYTCDKKDEWKNQQAGHFLHGHTKLTFFMPLNIHCQCPRCNTYLSGNEVVYTLKMIKEYGQEYVDELVKISKNGKVHTRKDIIKWIEFYTDELKKL